MKLPTLNSKKVVYALLALPLATVVLIGPLTGLVAGPATSPKVTERPSMQAAPAPQAPLTSMPTTEEVVVNEEPGLFGTGARAVGAMIVVLALIWITMILLKRYMPHRFGPLGHKRRIQVLETVPIGDKRSLTLIRIDGEGLLLASTPTTVSLIKEVRLSESDEATRQETPRNTSETNASVEQTSHETTLKFSDTLAAEIRHSGTSLEGCLAGFSRFRQELEAR